LAEAVNIRSKNLQTPLHMLILNFEGDQIDVDQSLFKLTFKLLVSKNVDINAKDENQMSSLHYAVMKYNHTAVLLLIECSEIQLNVNKDFFVNCDAKFN
jgi:ankyrin repeat protein